LTPAGWQFQETGSETPPRAKPVIKEAYFKHVKKASIRVNLASLIKQINKFPTDEYRARHAVETNFFADCGKYRRT
jgi:hypothetical protein